MRSRHRRVSAAVLVVLLTGCGSAAASGVVTPPSRSDSLDPAVSLTADSVSGGGDVGPAAAPAMPDEPVVVETAVWVPADDHRVPGTLAMPPTARSAPLPVVLMLHGDFSDRDGSGDLFGREAAYLAARGIASLRIDFAGSGDSEQPDLALSYPGMVADATASLAYLKADPRLQAARIAVIGMSRGGSIAATLAGTVPGVGALVEWSGAVSNGVDEDPEGHEQARTDGYVSIGGGFRVSENWFDTIEESHPLDDVAGYTGPILAVVGSADEVVPPEVADHFLQTVASTDVTLHTIPDASHDFDASTDDQTHAEEALTTTTDWLVSRLGL